MIDGELVDTDGRHNEGIREQGIYVLCHSAMPAVLVETGYIDNPDDEAYLNSEKGQDEIVASIVRAIENYKAEVEQVRHNNRLSWKLYFVCLSKTQEIIIINNI